jgi:hypothetical protein
MMMWFSNMRAKHWILNLSKKSTPWSVFFSASLFSPSLFLLLLLPWLHLLPLFFSLLLSSLLLPPLSSLPPSSSLLSLLNVTFTHSELNVTTPTTPSTPTSVATTASSSSSSSTTVTAIPIPSPTTNSQQPQAQSQGRSLSQPIAITTSSDVVTVPEPASSVTTSYMTNPMSTSYMGTSYMTNPTSTSYVGSSYMINATPLPPAALVRTAVGPSPSRRTRRAKWHLLTPPEDAPVRVAHYFPAAPSISLAKALFDLVGDRRRVCTRNSSQEKD